MVKTMLGSVREEGEISCARGRCTHETYVSFGNLSNSQGQKNNGFLM
jgi:hypothetical protein